MNTTDFYEKFPFLRSKNTTQRDIALVLSHLTAWNLFDLMMDTDSSILDTVVEGVAFCLKESL